MGSDVTWWGETDAGTALVRRFEEVEACCSRFRRDSELSRLNRDPRAEVDVSPMLAEVLATADHACALSGGRVDPTILDALEAAGYDRDLERARRTPVAPPPRRGGWESVSIAGRVVARPPGVRIDLGGVAKSWTARAALDLVEGRAFVDAAGDVAVRGPWVVAVEHGGAPVASLEVVDGGVATSGIDRRKWIGGHHIIDPATRRPAVTDVVAASVVAASVVDAETVARTIVLMGAWDGLGWAESLDFVRGALATTTKGVTLAIPATERIVA